MFRRGVTCLGVLLIFCSNTVPESAIVAEDRQSPRDRGATHEFESLVSEFVASITADSEHARAALVSPDSIRRIAAGNRTELGTPAVVVVTNERLVFITSDEDDLTESSVYYGDIADISISRDAAARVTVTGTDEVRWRCTLPDTNPEVLDAVLAHLRWVGHVRTQVCEVASTVDRAADAVRRHADEMDWETARERYRSARADLDEAITVVQLTAPVDNAVLAPELTDIERSLEEANVRLSIERARSQLEFGRHLVEREDYERAADVLGRARRHHDRALGQRSAVERPDAFAFGRQRALQDALDQLGQALATAVTEAVQQAQRAAARADEADGPTAAVEHWETAARRYHRLLDLDWPALAHGAAADTADLRTGRETAVDGALRARAELASRCWSDGARRHEENNTTGAIECCERAVGHLESAHELATEFDHADADAIADRLQQRRESLSEIRADGSDSTDSPAPGASPVVDGDANPAADASAPSADGGRAGGRDPHDKM